jgi:hypothetical protein
MWEVGNVVSVQSMLAESIVCPPAAIAFVLAAWVKIGSSVCNLSFAVRGRSAAQCQSPLRL